MQHQSLLRVGYASILALLVALEGIITPAAVTPAHAADAALVFAALDAIMQNHVTKQDPIKLLAAAVDGLRQLLKRAYISGSVDDLIAADEARAREIFQERFDRAVGLAQGRLIDTQFQYAAARAMAASVGDPNTFFLDPNEMLRNQVDRSVYSGIGVFFFRKDDRRYIFTVFPGSPAAKAGLHELDRVLAINGQSTQGMPGINFQSLLRGPQGTEVKLTVLRPGQSTPLTVSIARQPISPLALVRKMLKERIGYIQVLGFPREATAEFRRALAELKDEGMRGLVLDLRQTASLRPVEYRQIAGMLLPAGVPIETDVFRGSKNTFATSGDLMLESATPLVVLIDADTEFEGELLAAAIQETRRGKLVGVRTAGHVGNSTTLPLPGGASILVKTNEMLTGKGVMLEKNGVRPDVSVELTTGDLDRGVDTQLQRALQIIFQ